MSTRRGSGFGSGTFPASGMAGTSEDIALEESVALPEGTAAGVDIVSAEDIAAGIGSSRSLSLSALAQFSSKNETRAVTNAS